MATPHKHRLSERDDAMYAYMGVEAHRDGMKRNACPYRGPHGEAWRRGWDTEEHAANTSAMARWLPAAE